MFSRFQHSFKHRIAKPLNKVFSPIATQMGIQNILDFKFTSSVILKGKRWWRAKTNWTNMRMEIAKIEYAVDAPILFWKVNMIYNLRNNAADRKRSNPMWSKLTR